MTLKIWFIFLIVYLLLLLFQKLSGGRPGERFWRTSTLLEVLNFIFCLLVCCFSSEEEQTFFYSCLCYCLITAHIMLL